LKKNELNIVVAKMVSMGNGVMVNLISEDGLYLFLSLNSCANLLANKDEKSSVEVRKGYEDDNDKKYDPRPAVFAKYLGNNSIKVAIGKKNGIVKKSSDLHEAVIYEVKDLEKYLEIALIDLGHTEEYKEYKSRYFKSFKKVSNIVI
jgi:hypothetical protein